MSEARATTVETGVGEAYLPRTAFYVIGGNATAERFHGMRRRAYDGRGPQFWGIRGLKPFENSTTMRSDTLQNRLIDMQYLLRAVPDAPDDSPEDIASLKDWAFKPTDALRKAAEKTKRNRLINPLNKKKFPITNHEAHETPDIRHPAIESLIVGGDPTVEVIRVLEEWRQSNEDYYHVTDEQKELGREAFEVFLFSAGSERFIQALGYAAAQHYATHA